jgi:hypothetical protein
VTGEIVAANLRSFRGESDKLTHHQRSGRAKHRRRYGTVLDSVSAEPLKQPILRDQQSLLRRGPDDNLWTGSDIRDPDGNLQDFPLRDRLISRVGDLSMANCNSAVVDRIVTDL